LNISLPTRNFIVAAAIGIASGLLCWAFLHRFQLGGADFDWSHRAARALLAHENPYANTPPGTVPYPLPAALIALPFAPFPAEIAGALFFGLSSALLAFGLIRQAPERLLIFFAHPYWAALITAQWTPLIMCGAFFPLALAFCVAKPQTGTSIGLNFLFRDEARNVTRTPTRDRARTSALTGIIAAAALLLASFAIRPLWLMEWIPQARGYRYFVPFLVIPGPLLALALWRWRDRDARLLLVACILPQRWFYDSFVLWLIPKTRRAIMATVACSWIAGIWRWDHAPVSMHQVGLWCVLGSYIPMLAVVLLRPRRST
jgi:hypothetical protein